MLGADIQPASVLTYGRVAERCVLTLDAKGMLWRYIASVDLEVIVD